MEYITKPDGMSTGLFLLAAIEECRKPPAFLGVLLERKGKTCHKLKLFLAVFDMVCYNH